MPDAHAPTRNQAGDIMYGWWVRVGYDEIRDQIVITIHRERVAPKHAGHMERVVDGTDVEDAVAHAAQAIRTLGARRLF